jgi:hypothetical protein
MLHCHSDMLRGSMVAEGLAAVVASGEGRRALAAGGTVLKTIRADEVGHCGKALEVRYRAEPGEPEVLVVDLAACETDGELDHVRRSEMVLLVTSGRMTRESLRERVEVEAARRAIERVCWIEEDRSEEMR